jgi:hypothetical protein
VTTNKLRRSQIYVIGTIVVLTVLGAFYLLIVVPGNERTLVERRYRVLQNVVANVVDKVENSDSLLARIVEPLSSGQRDQFIKAQNQKGSFRIEGSGNYPRDKQIYQTSFATNIDSATQIITLSCKVGIHSKEKRRTPDSAFLSMNYSSRQLLAKLLPDQIFDEYLVLYKSSVLYESFASQLSPDLADSIVRLKPKLSSAAVPIVTLSGIRYRAFLQGFSLMGTSSLTIVGLMKQEEFQDQRMQLPAGILMVLMTIVLVIIIGFPWIKLYQMGSKDRLTMTDIVATVVGLMLLMGLIFFVSYKYCRITAGKSDSGSLNNLSTSLLSRFQKERNGFYELIKSFDAARRNQFLTSDSAQPKIDRLKPVNVPRSTKPASNILTRRTLLSPLNFGKTLKIPFDSTRVDQVFWLDSSGKEVENWTTKKDAPLNGNYKNRNYFKRLIEQSAYQLSRNDTGKPYFLDQIISWTDGLFSSVISVPVNPLSGGSGIRVVAMTFTFTSLTTTILPTGYAFAMVDNTGKVLYHSIESKNLNENLVSEFSEGSTLYRYLRSGAEGYFTTKYLDETYRVKISPVPDMPYSLLVLENTEYEESVDVEVYSFTFIMFFLVTSFSVVLSLVSLFLATRKSIFQKQSFDVIRFAPKRSEARIYNISCLFGIWLIVLLSVYLSTTHIPVFLFLIPIAIIMQSLFYNAVLYSQELRRKREQANFRKISIIWLIGMLAVVFFFAVVVLCFYHLLHVLIFVLIGFAGAVILFFLRPFLWWCEKLRPLLLSQKHYYVVSFVVMLTIRLIINCGIPVVFFYLSSSFFHNVLSTRDRFLQQSEKMYALSPNMENIYPDGNYFKAFTIDLRKQGDNNQTLSASSTNNFHKSSRESHTIISMFNTFRVALTQASRNAAGLAHVENPDNTLYFNPLPLDLSRDYFVQLNFPNRNRFHQAQLTSGKIAYQPPRLGSEFPNPTGTYAFILLLLCLFVCVSRQTIRKLFALNLPNLKNLNRLDKEIIRDNEINNLLFVIGLPGAGKLEYIKDLLKGEKLRAKNDELLELPKEGVSGNVFVADLINTPDADSMTENEASWKEIQRKIFDPAMRLIILNHFEYNMQVDITSRLKLNLLEQLMQRDQCKIIVLSTVHPVAFLDSLNDHRRSSKDQSVITHDLERWHVLLGHYRMVILPIQLVPQSEKDLNAARGNPMISKIIRQETSTAFFISRMAPAVARVVDKTNSLPTGKLQDELSFKMQITSHYFYMYIWQSLTKEEKYLLYDLAEDRLVNSYDTYNLSLLVAKGVIVDSDGLLTFFNRGFRNFILTAIGHAEASKIQNRLVDTGNWNNLRLPIIMVLGAILSFLFFSQQEAYSIRKQRKVTVLSGR